MKELFGKCQYLSARQILTGKWAIYILYLLIGKTMRFNELLRHMPENMTPTSLSNQLKSLEQQRLVIRRDYNEMPLRVEYSLTETAECFKTVTDAIESWGKIYIEAVRDIKWPEETSLCTKDMLEAHICDVIRLTNRMLTGRWTMNIMYSLEKKPLRFGEILQKTNEGLTPTTLSKYLKFLESEGMIERIIHNEMPIVVEYSQTYVGLSFKLVLNTLSSWCDYYRESN